jgi:hypothetical protein
MTQRGPEAPLAATPAFLRSWRAAALRASLIVAAVGGEAARATLAAPSSGEAARLRRQNVRPTTRASRAIESASLARTHDDRIATLIDVEPRQKRKAE